MTALASLTDTSLRVGDVVMIRSGNPPTPVGNGVTYDFAMWNRVTGWDPDRGLLELELPVPRDIVASDPSPTVLQGPTLCVNDGLDPFMREPWSIVQNVEIANLSLHSAGSPPAPGCGAGGSTT